MYMWMCTFSCWPLITTCLMGNVFIIINVIMCINLMRIKSEISVIHFVYIYERCLSCMYVHCTYNLNIVNSAVLLIHPLAHRAHMFWRVFKQATYCIYKIRYNVYCVSKNTTHMYYYCMFLDVRRTSSHLINLSS